MEDSEEALRADISTGCRILAHRGLAHDIIGHISARGAEPGTIWVRCRGANESGLLRTQPDAVRLVSTEDPGDPGEGYDLPLELPIHTSVYRARPDVLAVAHAHAPYAVLCSVAGIPLRPVYGSYESDGMLLAYDGVPTYPRSRHVSDNVVGREMADCLGQHRACLLRGHGIVTTGRSVAEAVLTAIRLERLAWFTWQLSLVGATDAADKLEQDDIDFFARPERVDIPEAMARRWASYIADLENG